MGTRCFSTEAALLDALASCALQSLPPTGRRPVAAISAGSTSLACCEARRALGLWKMRLTRSTHSVRVSVDLTTGRTPWGQPVTT